MNTTPWAERVQAAIEHFEKGGRVWTTDEYLAIIDDLVLLPSVTQLDLVAKYGYDRLITTLGHVTMALQGKGNGGVMSLGEGGWYQRVDDHFVLAPGFAAAWKQQRGL